MNSRFLAFVLPLCLIAGCQSASPVQTGDLPAEFRNAGMPDAAEMKLRCLDQIPPGTTIEKAEAVMTGSGFKVQQMSDGQGAYLFCELDKNGAKRFGTKNWKVKIRYAAGVVDDISVSTGQNGS